jgi:iron(III) transport system permease protein
LESLVGLERLPSIYGFPGALLVLTLLSYPYILLSVRAALLRMDSALEESSRSLGHGPWKTFQQVTLPQLRPALAAGSLLVALYTLRDFGAVSLMRYDTFTRVIYIQYQSSFDRTSAAVLALVLVLMTLVILVLEVRTRGHARYHGSSVGTARPQPVSPLGHWRWLALLFCGAVVGLALVLPAGVLVYWLVRGLQADEQLTPLWLATRNSVLASGLAAGVTLLAALPVAVLSVRWPGRLTNLLERLTYAGFALPGIVIALALVFFGARYTRPLYQTLPLLILAYLILFLPQAVGAVRASLLQVHPHLEESARSLGRRPWQVFSSITLPLAWPGVAAGAGLVFLTAMKELPATLILGPFGFKTLPTVVWSAVSEAFFARAAAPALLIILASSVPMAFLVLGEPKER